MRKAVNNQLPLLFSATSHQFFFFIGSQNRFHLLINASGINHDISQDDDLTNWALESIALLRFGEKNVWSRSNKVKKFTIFSTEKLQHLYNYAMYFLKIYTLKNTVLWDTQTCTCRCVQRVFIILYTYTVYLTTTIMIY